MDMTIEQFLDLASNAEKYAAKLKELRDQDEKLKQTFGGVSKLQQADAILAKADEAVKKAQATADEIVSEANAYVSKQKEYIQAEYKDVQEQRRVAGDIRQHGLDAEARAKETMKSVEIREKALAKEYALLNAKREEVEKLQVELKERLERLRSVMT